MRGCARSTPTPRGCRRWFIAALRRALAHYGIASLERTPALGGGVLPPVPLPAARRDRAHGDRGDPRPPARGCRRARRSRRRGVPRGPRPARDRARGRDPVVADLAREVRFRYFDEPRDRGGQRAGVRARWSSTSRRSRASPSAPDARELLTEIVDCPRPLAPRLTVAMGSAAPAARRLLVEAMARRYYRTRSLGGFEHLSLGGHDVALARYLFGGTNRQLATAYVELDDVTAIADRLCPSRRDASAAIASRCSTSTRSTAGRRRRARRPRLVCAPRLRRFRLRRRFTASSSRSPSRAGAGGCRRSTCSRSGPDRAGWSRTRCCAACTR